MGSNLPVQSKAVGVIFGLAFLSIGLFMIGIGAYSGVRLAIANLTWSQVPASILSSFVETGTTTKGRTNYIAHVSYQYRFHGGLYSSTRIGASPVNSGVSGTNNTAADWVAEHPAGSTTTAYVDPNSPDNSALDIQMSFVIVLLMLFPIPHTLVGLSVICGVLVGNEKAKQYTPLLRRTLIGWGALALVLALLCHSLTWPAAISLTVYFGFLYLAIRKGIRAFSKGTGIAGY
jgi:hypothetical protein